MTRSVGLDHGRLRMILPGTWVQVPLGDPETTRAVVKRIVRDRVGRADRLAAVRREGVAELVATAESAARAGAHTLLLSLELLPGVPFPASMVATDVPWPQAVEIAALVEEGRTAEALAAAFPDREVMGYAEGPVARSTEFAEEVVGTTPSTVLRLEYLVPDPAGVLLLVRVSVPTVPTAEPYATLFDEIVDSIRWAPRRSEEDVQ